MDFGTVDVRYESSDCTYQDLIDAVHDKGMKIVQDIVWNHSGNFGETELCHMFDKQYSSVKDLEKISSMVVNPNGPLAKNYPNYASLNDDAQYQARLACMKTDKIDNTFNYHHSADMSYESYTEQTGQMAGDCVDINTEKQQVADYLTDAYMDYVNMGVDAFRLDTEKHISRWTLNHAFFPKFRQVENFYIFGEVCARVRDIWNHGIQADSCPFYGWKETESQWTNNWSKTDWKSNYDNAIKHFTAHSSADGAPTSDNAFLKNGTTYHTPDYSKANGTGTIDFSMHWNFDSARDAYNCALGEDKYFNDSTWNVMYVDSHDYAPDSQQTVRFNGGTTTWAENMDLMFTFRGIPCVYYGSEVEFQKGMVIDVGPNKPLSQTGRAYFGDKLEGSVSASDSGRVLPACRKVDRAAVNLHIRICCLDRAIRGPVILKRRRAVPDAGGAVSADRFDNMGVLADRNLRDSLVTAADSRCALIKGTVISAAALRQPDHTASDLYDRV